MILGTGSVRRRWAAVVMLCLASPTAQSVSADFTTSGNSGCASFLVSFFDASTGSPTKWLWDFGNGNTSTLKNPGAIYVAGTYTVTLTVEDALGNKDTKKKIDLIVVHGKPTVNFKSDKFGGCAPLTVNFTNQSTQGTSNVTTWVWDFGDGSTSTQKDPGPHTYSTNGRFDVTLFAKDANGCQHSVTKKSFIAVPVKPVVDFTADKTAACAPSLSVSFTPVITMHTGGSPKYAWDFGDGSSSTSSNPSHTYTANGSYNVSLTITDSAGCANTSTKNGFIKIGKPVANFSFPSSGCSPFFATFTNTTNPLPGGTTFLWDFGDGKTSTAQDPGHTYASAGNYTVKLIVNAPGGCVDSISKGPITVKTGPVPSFTAQDTLGCSLPHKVSFTNTTTAGTLVGWDFGDGSTGIGNNPSHTYTRFDTFSVSLTYALNGCTTKVTKKDLVLIAKLKAGFTATPISGCLPISVKVTDTTNTLLPITGWEWDFGDGSKSTQKNPPAHVYNTEGTYLIKLKVKTGSGSCADSTTRSIKTGKRPKADFSATPVSGCVPLDVKFTNLTNTHTVQADSFFWDFGDGGTSVEVSPRHTYDVKPAKYTVRLIAKNKGCNDTLIMKDLINLFSPWARFELKQPKCESDSIYITDKAVNYNTIQYDFGDGTTTTTKNPVHRYAAPGSYKVTQIVKNDTSGCVDTFTVTVLVDKMTAGFTADDTIGCYPLAVKFTPTINRGSWSAYELVWDFGDGTTSNAIDPIHTYTQKGVFDVTLTVNVVSSFSSDYGCSSVTKRKKYITTRGPVPGFSVTPDRGCSPLTVKIKDNTTSDHRIVSRVYDMGDGVKISGKDSFEYTYSAPPAVQSGGYTITLTVKDSIGCSVTFGRSVYPSKPKPDFSQYVVPKCDKLEYQFIPDGNGFSPFVYQWSFGDGGTSNDNAPVHEFTKNGTYKITLVATDGNGCVDSISRDLTVIIKFPEAKFTATPPDTTCPPLFVHFADKSTQGFSGFKSWFWEFGDGTSSNLRNPQKLYSLPGKYTVKLTVTDSLGCMATVSENSAVIVDGPVGTYSISSLRGCRPFTVTFTATSVDATGFKWDMGNGVILDGNPVTFTYDSQGQFIPALILIREAPDDTCIYSLPNKDTLIVDPLPTPGFSSYGQCFGYPTFFTDTSTSSKGSIIGWEWDFGDGSTSTEQHPSHVYKGPSLYTVKLTSISSLGCRNKVEKKVKIGGLDARFDISSNTGCVGHPLSFTDRTFADTAVVAWTWDFGDGDSSAEQSPTHTYMQKGFYNVKLISRDFKGCIDTIIHTGFLIGDTIPPPSPVIYRVTVENDNTIRLDFERYKDIDFKEYIIYRKDPGGAFVPLDTLRSRNDTIYFDPTVDPRNNVYCYRVRARNVCDYFSPLVSPEHCSIGLDAAPGINRSVLTWNAYTGWVGVAKYEIYREYVYSPGTYLLIGTVAGSTLTYTDTGIICYRTHHYRVKAYELGGTGQVSWSDTAAATPIYVPNVPSNEVIRATVENDKHVRVEWTDVPAAIKHKYFILQRSLNGISYTTIDTAFARTDLDYTDTRVEVDDVSYYYRLFVMDSCGDLSALPSNIGKTILLKVDTAADLRPRLTWTGYKSWKEGVQYYDIQLKQPDGTWQKIARTLTGTDTVFTDNLTNVNTLPEYCYRVIAYRDGPAGNSNINLHITSMSNEDCTPVRSILWVPNAFSPNGDSANDVFRAKGMYIVEFEMKIYDRWGTLVYHGSSLSEGWDGTFKGDRPVNDSYRWMIVAKGADWVYHYRNGWVTILR